MLKSFTYPVIDAGFGNMKQFEENNPDGYYKIVRPRYFNETANEYELIFYSAEDEPLKTVSERFVIGNLFNEGVFGNGLENDIGYFLFNDPDKYERREADGNPPYHYEFDVTESYVFDGNSNGRASGIMLITPQGFNQPLAVDYDAQTPFITAQPENLICEQGREEDLLAVGAESIDNGSLTYQWFVSTTQSNTSGSAVSGEDSYIFTPPTTTVGEFYYYCEITNTNSSATRNTTATVKSDAVKVDVRAVYPTVPDNPDVGDPTDPNGDTLGVIKAADNSADLAPTIDSTTLEIIFTADYNPTPGENEQNVFDSTTDQPVIDAGGFVVITVVVEKKTEDLVPADIRAEAAYSAADEVMPLDISLIKSIFNDSGLALADDKIVNAQTAELLEIAIKLPPEMQGKLNYKLIRKHGSEITVLRADETDITKERIEVSGDTLTIYAKKFSDYVLIADNPPVLPDPPDTGIPAGVSGIPENSTTPPPANSVPVLTGNAAANTAETDESAPAKFIIAGEVVRLADITNKSGSINANKTLKNLEEVYKNAVGNVESITIVVTNATFISYPTFDRIAQFANIRGIDVMIYADTVAQSKVLKRLMINVKVYDKTDKGIYLNADVYENGCIYMKMTDGGYLIIADGDIKKRITNIISGE